MASGVSVNKDCKDRFEDIKMRRAFRYIIYRLSDDLKQIEVEKTAPITSTYDDFVEDLKEAEGKKQCRFAIIEAEYQKADTMKSKLVFFYWGPEGAAIKQKMVYSSSKEKLRSELGPGISMMIQANDHSDLEHEEITKRLLDADKYM